MCVIRDSLAQTDAPGASSESEASPDTSSPDPFLFEFDTGEWELSDKAIDRGLSMLIALTNLL